MAEFTVNPFRKDPYKGCKFLVRWDGRIVPGISHVSGLVWDTQVVTYREGGSPNQFVLGPGLTSFEPLVLRRGRTHDPAFEDWAALVWSYSGSGATPVKLNEMRKDIVVALLNEAGQEAMAFKVHRCWPSRYEPIGALDANDTAVAYESLTLRHEGFERDPSVGEPEQP